MSNTSWSVTLAGVLVSGCVLLMACGSSPPTATDDDAGTLLPDGGRIDEPTQYTCPIPAPTACPTPAPRYADVAPIFERRCVVCHAGAPGGPWSLANYGHVADWQDTIRPNVRDCTMPPSDAGIPISREERTAILTWIRCGLPQ